MHSLFNIRNRRIQETIFACNSRLTLDPNDNSIVVPDNQIIIDLRILNAMSTQYIEELDKFTKEPSHNTSNAIGHINLVENLVRLADKELQQYHKLIETFRQELHLMKSRIENNHQQTLNTMNPSVDALNGEFEMSTDSQKEENLNFQNQLTELKKEKSIIGQMITASHKRTEFLLGQVGKY